MQLNIILKKQQNTRMAQIKPNKDAQILFVPGGLV